MTTNVLLMLASLVAVILTLLIIMKGKTQIKHKVELSCLGTLPLSQNSRLVVVNYEGDKLLLAVTANSIRCINRKRKKAAQLKDTRFQSLFKQFDQSEVVKKVH